MRVVVTGTNFVNKGAQLMMHAIVDELRTWPEVEQVAMPLEAGSASQRRSGGVDSLLSRKVDRSSAVETLLARLGNVVPPRVARTIGTMRVRDVSLVLDASGYIYSDRSGPRASRRSARAFRRFRQSGARVVLLPQAFGPFDDNRVRSSFREALASVDLAYARDPQSLEHLTELAPPSLATAVAPDFTIPCPGSAAEDVVRPFLGRACLIPNARMLRDTDRGTAAWYVSTMGDLADHLGGLGLEPYVLLHEAGDAPVAAAIDARSARSIQVVSNSEPRALKAIIASAPVAIGSRYHALVGALSSAVPAIGIGWSHKYAALFRDFGVEDLCIPNNAPSAGIRDVIDRLVSADGGRVTAATLRDRTAELTAQVASMWARVRAGQA